MSAVAKAPQAKLGFAPTQEQEAIMASMRQSESTM